MFWGVAGMTDWILLEIVWAIIWWYSDVVCAVILCFARLGFGGSFDVVLSNDEAREMSRVLMLSVSE